MKHLLQIRFPMLCAKVVSFTPMTMVNLHQELLR